MSRRDWPLNSTMQIPWTLNLAAVGVAQPPSTVAADAEIPVGAFDVRHSRGYAIQLNPGTTTGTATVELQWSLDGVYWISMGSNYQTQIPAGSPSASIGFLVSNPWYPLVRLATIGAGASGSANVYFAARD